MRTIPHSEAEMHGDYLATFTRKRLSDGREWTETRGFLSPAHYRLSLQKWNDQQPDNWAYRDASPLPLTPSRAAEILEQAPKDSFGGRSCLRGGMTGEESSAVNRYWRDIAPGSWSFNDVVRHCAKAGA